MKKTLIERLQNLGIPVEGLALSELKILGEQYGIIKDGIIIPMNPKKSAEQPAPPAPPASEPPAPEPPAPEPPAPEPPAPEPPAPEPPKDDFQTLKDKIKNATPETGSDTSKKGLITISKTKRGKRQSDPDSFRIEGYVLIMVTDTIFPFAFSFVNNFFDSHVKVKGSELQLTDKQLTKIEPLADQAADYLSFKINPVWGFVIVSGIMYGSNLMILRDIKSESLKTKLKTVKK
jgi:hypothetical protein